MVVRTLENLENLENSWNKKHDLENLDNLENSWNFVISPRKFFFHASQCLRNGHIRAFSFCKIQKFWGLRPRPPSQKRLVYNAIFGREYSVLGGKIWRENTSPRKKHLEFF